MLIIRLEYIDTWIFLLFLQVGNQMLSLNNFLLLYIYFIHNVCLREYIYRYSSVSSSSSSSLSSSIHSRILPHLAKLAHPLFFSSFLQYYSGRIQLFHAIIIALTKSQEYVHCHVAGGDCVWRNTTYIFLSLGSLLSHHYKNSPHRNQKANS